jgi:hypothetical protein
VVLNQLGQQLTNTLVLLRFWGQKMAGLRQNARHIQRNLQPAASGEAATAALGC